MWRQPIARKMAGVAKASLAALELQQRVEEPDRPPPRSTARRRLMQALSR